VDPSSAHPIVGLGPQERVSRSGDPEEFRREADSLVLTTDMTVNAIRILPSSMRQFDQLLIILGGRMNYLRLR